MLKKITNNSQICIIASDPGGAEPLYRICKEINCKKFFFLSGAAKKIFKNIKSNKSSELNKSILKSDFVLCSSSFSELSYYNAIQFAKCNNIHTTLVLDHWTFFKDRLKKNRNDKLPDDVVVFDIHAKKIVNKEFPKLKTILMKNPYLFDLIDKIKKKSEKKDVSKKVILYCTDKIENMPTIKKPIYDYSVYNYNEFEALKFFFINLKKIGIEVDQIILRTHPNEKVNKYKKIINEFKNEYDIITNNKDDLITQIAKSDFVVGCETFPMVIASMSAKKVFSSVPPNGKEISLPQKNIKYIRDLI